MGRQNRRVGRVRNRLTRSGYLRNRDFDEDLEYYEKKAREGEYDKYFTQKAPISYLDPEDYARRYARELWEQRGTPLSLGGRQGSFRYGKKRRTKKRALTKRRTKTAKRKRSQRRRR